LCPDSSRILDYTSKIFPDSRIRIPLQYLRVTTVQTEIPECPWVSKAVPKNRTYSVSDACKTYIDPIQPPALINSHSLTSSGNTWPGYFLSISNAMLENVADILLSV